MATQQPRPRIPNIRFRVLIIGRANAGKTTILQRICDTTESPVIYRGSEEVKLDPSMDRGEHTIEDELVFSNHRGYVFHDSRGIESASTEELEILQEFIRRKSRAARLRDRLHAIWYCVPMDNQRPQLDLRFFNGICPDENVPVIAVFTKYDQFRRNVKINLEDYGNPGDDVTEVTEKVFQEHYLHPLGDHVRFVRLEQMHRQNRGCDELIEKTAAALNEDTTALMLLAVQKHNLKLSVTTALNRVHSQGRFKVEGAESIVRQCLFPFPYIWWYFQDSLEQQLKDDSELLDLEYSWSKYKKEEQLLDSWLLKKKSKLSWFDLLEYSKLELKWKEHLVAHIMSLPTIQNFTTDLSDQHLILAVILILKHATFLCLSNMSAELALTHAELDYQAANIDLKIQQYTASSQEHSIELFTAFIMSTDIVPFESSVGIRVDREGRRFKRIWESLTNV